MTENEQIQEITKVLCADYDNCEGCSFAVHFVDYSTCVPKEQAERIVTDKGYRKIDHGKWEANADGTHWCSECGHDATYTYDGIEVCGVCCPFCGADTRGEDDV